MIILPAIDLIDGKCVRLYQGDYGQSEVVANSVIQTAEAFEKAGAGWIHMVDLDGARLGRRCNEKSILEVVKNTGLKVETGGGIRTMDDVKFYIDNGVSRVILGTAAINDPVFLKEALSAYGDKIAVGLDCKDGYACASGWLEKSDLHYLSFAAELVRMGVRNIIFTDISRDGTLHGPNLEMLKELQAHADCDITASGGISSLDDIRKLNDLGLYGAITGKAIYSGALPLAEAVRICRRDA